MTGGLVNVVRNILEKYVEVSALRLRETMMLEMRGGRACVTDESLVANDSSVPSVVLPVTSVWS